MKCPLRLKTTYNYKKGLKDGSLVVESQTEEWAECYGEECPFYNTWVVGNCTKLEDFQEG